MMEALGLPSAAWALQTDALSSLLAQMQPNALLNRLPRKADTGQRLANEEGVGVLFVHGPLFKRASLVTNLFGFTTYERLRRDLQAALDDKKIEAIALHIDSPGGEANGCDELANAIYEARRKKPIRAFVSGMACSGGYWIASATQHITASEASVIGSIGVALAITPTNDAKRVDFVSSRSPGKRADPTTAAGRSRFQKMVDDLGDVFIAHVARNRGTTPATVADKYGQGGVLVGQQAVKAGMVDAIGQWPDVLKSLRGSYLAHRANPANLALSNPRAPSLAVAAPIPAAPVVLSKVEAARRQAEAAATARVAAICQSPEGQAFPDLAAELALDTSISAADALERLKAKAREEKIAESWRKAADKINEHVAPGAVKLGGF